MQMKIEIEDSTAMLLCRLLRGKINRDVRQKKLFNLGDSQHPLEGELRRIERQLTEGYSEPRPIR